MWLHDQCFPDGLKQLFTQIGPPFPDIHLTIEDLTAERDTVVMRVTARGMHKVEISGVQSAVKPVTVTEVHTHRIVNGKVQESWTEYDRLAIFQQLGFVPAPMQAGS